MPIIMQYGPSARAISAVGAATGAGQGRQDMFDNMLRLQQLTQQQGQFDAAHQQQADQFAASQQQQVKQAAQQHQWQTQDRQAGWQEQDDRQALDQMRATVATYAKGLTPTNGYAPAQIGLLTKATNGLLGMLADPNRTSKEKFEALTQGLNLFAENPPAPPPTMQEQVNSRLVQIKDPVTGKVYHKVVQPDGKLEDIAPRGEHEPTSLAVVETTARIAAEMVKNAPLDKAGAPTLSYDDAYTWAEQRIAKARHEARARAGDANGPPGIDLTGVTSPTGVMGGPPPQHVPTAFEKRMEATKVQLLDRRRKHGNKLAPADHEAEQAWMALRQAMQQGSITPDKAAAVLGKIEERLK